MINEIEIDTRIIEEVNLIGGIIRRRELLEKLKQITKTSQATLNRHIKRLIHKKKLKILKNDALVKIGFLQESDKRASYIISVDKSEYINHMENVLKTFKKKDVTQKTTALLELETNNTYPLTPKQLDIIIEEIGDWDSTLTNSILRILLRHKEKNIFPSNKEYFIEKLKKELQRFAKNTSGVENLRNKIIQLLGIYNDPIIIEELKKDILICKDTDLIEREYSSNEVANIIEKNAPTLFNFQIKLEKDGKKELSKLIFRIRNNARKKLTQQKEDLNII